MEMRGSKEAKLGRMIFDGPFRCHEERRGYVTVQASRGKEGNLLFFSDRSGVTGKEGLFFVKGGGRELRSRLSKLHASTEQWLEVGGVLGSGKE